MIYESYPWKQDLMRRRNLIRQYNNAEKLEDGENDRAYTVMEKAIFYSAFIIRKLIDCTSKVSDEVDNYKLSVECRRPIKEFDIMSLWPENDTHDWDHFTTESVLGRTVCNWLIHSFFFIFCFGEDGAIDGFHVASDYDKNKALYYIKLSDWLKYIDFVASDNIVELRIQYNPQKGERVPIRKKRG